MGKRMRLFGVPDLKGLEELQVIPIDQQQAILAAAWGGFNTIMWADYTSKSLIGIDIYRLQSLFYVASPTAYPPALPIPGSLGIAGSYDRTAASWPPEQCLFKSTHASL